MARAMSDEKDRSGEAAAGRIPDEIMKIAPKEIYKPSSLLAFLESIGTSPKKRLSQNFLIDQNILHKIVKEADVSPGDVVLEIGPGPGSLTEALLAKGARVVAVEKDPLLAKALHRLQTPDERLTVIEEDILKVSFEDLFDGTSNLKVKVIANLPYHLTTPILVTLVKKTKLFSMIVVMVQLEVAQRMTGALGSPDYSSFTLFLRFFSDVFFSFPVGKNCFYPAPKVDSAIIKAVLKEPPPVSSEEDFFALTRKAFGQRRKMLRASLKDLYPKEKLLLALDEVHLKGTQRPAELSLEDFLALFEALQKNKAHSKDEKNKKDDLT